MHCTAADCALARFDVCGVRMLLSLEAAVAGSLAARAWAASLARGLAVFRDISNLIEVRRFPAIILESVRGFVSQQRDVLDYIVAALVGMCSSATGAELATVSRLPHRRCMAFPPDVANDYA